MLDFDPKTQIAIMPQDVAMKFMIWAAYFNDLDMAPGKSFARFKRPDGSPLFGAEDAARLDRLQDVLFKCFEPASVAAAISSLKRARAIGEPCPYPEESLNALFGKAE